MREKKSACSCSKGKREANNPLKMERDWVDTMMRSHVPLMAFNDGFLRFSIRTANRE